MEAPAQHPFRFISYVLFDWVQLLVSFLCQAESPWNSLPSVPHYY